MSHTMPVGVGLPLPPLTVIVTGRACVELMLDEDGTTDTVTEPTVTNALPAALTGA
jgi:hypothetical protein